MTGQRILIGARCFADAELAIPIAVDLAKQVGASLHGVFVEDETMLDFSHTMTLIAASGAHRTASRDAMERACLGDAMAFRRMLAGAARAARIDWAFDTGRGLLPSLLHTTARRGDLLLYGYRPPFAARYGIAIMVDGVPGNEGLIDLSVALAERTRKPFHAIIVGEKELSALNAKTGTSAEDAGSLKDACNALQKLGLSAVVVAPGPDAEVTLDDILGAARAPVICAVR